MTRLRRGFVLAALHLNYPYPVTRIRLDQEALPFYADLARRPGDDAVALTRDLSYLAEKGYIEATEETLVGRVIRSYRLTTRGVDLVEGSITDPGVEPPA